MSKLENELLEIIKILKEEIRLNDQRIRQLIVQGGGGIWGDMFKAVYDADRDDVVDNAKRLNGHTSDEFAPASHSHTESDLSFSDVTTGDVSTSKHGLCPKIAGNDGYVLTKSGDQATWAAPTGGGGSGDMLKSVYDKDNDGVVDNAKLIEGRKIYVMNRPPQSGEGNNGDIWIEY